MSSATLTKNYEFYSNADLSMYGGEWVAIINEKVIAHGKQVKELMKKANETNPGVTPFIVKVPKAQRLLALGQKK